MKRTSRSLLKAVCGPLAGAALLSACYTYQPIEMADLRPNLDVRTRVSGAEADRLNEFLGSDERVVDGTIDDLTADNLLLRVSVVTAIDRGSPGGALSQRVEIPRSSVVEVEVKELDRRRTGFMAGTLTAIVGILVLRQLNQDQGGGDVIPPPPPPEDRGIRFPIRLLWGGS